MSDAQAHAHPAADPAAGHGHGDIDAHVRKAYYVFGALMALTGLTVAVAYLHLPVPAAIALALLIASLKGSLVAGWFMHLVSERPLIFAVLALSLFFFLFLLLMPVWTTGDAPTVAGSGSGKGAFSHTPPPAAAPAGH